MTRTLEEKIEDNKNLLANLDLALVELLVARKHEDYDTINKCQKTISEISNEVVVYNVSKEYDNPKQIGATLLEAYQRLNSHKKALTMKTLDVLFSMCVRSMRDLKIGDDVISGALDLYKEAKKDVLQGEAERDMDNLKILSANEKYNEISELSSNEKGGYIKKAFDALSKGQVRLFISYYGLGGGNVIQYLHETDPNGIGLCRISKQCADIALDAYNDMLDLKKQKGSDALNGNDLETKIVCKEQDFDFWTNQMKLANKLYREFVNAEASK